MMFIAPKKALKSALESVSSVCKKTAAYTTLFAMLNVTNGVLTLTGYDLETGITAKIDVTTPIGEIDNFSFLVDCQKTFEIVSKFTAENIECTVKNDTIIMKCGKSKCKISTRNAEDFPNIPETSFENSVQIESEMLLSMIKQTVFAAAKENSNKPILAGECFTFSDGFLEVAALDGFRSAVRGETVNTGLKAKFVVKGESLKIMSKLAKNANKITIYPNKKHAIFSFGNTLFFSRLLDGDFHNYKASIPSETPSEIVISVSKMIESLERFLVFIDAKERVPIKCEFEGDKLRLSVKSSIGEMEDIVDTITSPNDKITIGFNVRYLIDVFKNIEVDRVSLHLKNGLSPMKITPINSNEFTYLVLPVRLKN